RKGFVDRGAQAWCAPRPREKVEVERGVKLVWPQVLGEAIDVRKPDLADKDARRDVVVGDRSPAAIDVVDLVAIRVRMLTGGRIGGDFGESWILDQERRRINPDAGHTAVEPETKDRFVLPTDVGMAPVEVRLLSRE